MAEKKYANLAHDRNIMKPPQREEYAGPEGPSGMTVGPKSTKFPNPALVHGVGGPNWRNQIWELRNPKRSQIQIAKYMPNNPYKNPGGPQGLKPLAPSSQSTSRPAPQVVMSQTKLGPMPAVSGPTGQRAPSRTSGVFPIGPGLETTRI